MSPDGVFGNPQVSVEAFVSAKAELIGRVIVEEHVLVGPQASLRADEEGPFRICKGSNVQDHVIMHGFKGKKVEVQGQKYSIYLGPNTIVAHRAIVHGPVLIEGGEPCFIGFASQVISAVVGSGTYISHGAEVRNAKVGRRCIIGDKAMVIGVEVPDGKWVPYGKVLVKQKEVELLEDARENELKGWRELSGEVIEVNHDLVVKYRERETSQEEFEARKRAEEGIRRLKQLKDSTHFSKHPSCLQCGVEVLKAIGEIPEDSAT